MSQPLLSMHDIDLSFSGVTILDKVGFDMRTGEIHALMGANGAGKSSLMKIVTGLYARDGGSIEFDRDGGGTPVPVELATPRMAQEAGISIVHQEFNLFDNMTIAENLLLTREPVAGMGRIDWAAMRHNASDLLMRIRLDADPMTMVGDLTVGQKQMVEIAKSLSFKSRLLIMDEPTAALSEKETNILFSLLFELRDQGLGIVYISHRMEEIFRVADRITVMRDGRHVGTMAAKETDSAELIRLMTGKVISGSTSASRRAAGETAMTVRRFSNRHLKDVNLKLRKGEIIGLFGLVGAGRTELVRAIFGIDKIEAGGEVFVNGERARIARPEDAVRSGMGLVPEDRKTYGGVMGMSIKKNMILARLKDMPQILLGSSFERETVGEYVEKLGIKLVDENQTLSELSGGNQQKVIMAKWLSVRPAILLLDEPTRGIDVGAKADIYQIMREYADAGISILMISSELPEVLAVSDRVLVMREGRIVLDVVTGETDSKAVMTAALGG